MSSLSELSIRRPVFAWMLMAAILVFGALSFQRLGISRLPDVDFPVVGISFNLPGAAPEVVESQVLDPAEDALMQIDGIRNLTSTAQQSSGSISVEFDLDRDIDQAIQDIAGKVNQARNLLPITLLPPTIRKSNPEDQPIFWLAVTSDDPNLPPIELMSYARNVLYDQFSVVPGVGNINLGGYVEPALRVWTDLDKLNRYEMTSEDVIQAIRQGQIETPAGRIESRDQEYNVRVLGEATTPEDFGKIIIGSRKGGGINYRPLQLGQLAKIEEGTGDVRRLARLNGRRAVGLGILKQHGSNAVQVANDIRARLREIQPTIPKPYRVEIRSDSTRFIKQSVDQLLFTLILSAILTSAVCFFFLGSWTSTINVLMAIPTSIVGTFVSFYFLGFTLNTFTLLGLSLAIGIVVDDAIMMLENIVRHRELGENRRQAAIKGAREITFAAVAATIAVVAIFLPVVFMKGVIGRYFLQYGVTVAVAVMLSLLEALTLTPMRCSRYLVVSKKPKGLARMVEHGFVRLARGYERILRFLLQHRLKTVVVTLACFAASMLLTRTLPSEMIPAQDQSQIMLRLKLPVGSSFPLTDEKIRKVEAYLNQQKEIDGFFTVVGGFGGDSSNQGQIVVMLVDRNKRQFSQQELVQKFRKDLRKEVKGAQIIAQDMSQRGFSSSRGFPIEFIIQGPDWEKLSALATDIMEAMRKTGDVTDVNTDVQAGMPELQLVPNREALARHGVALSTVTSTINSLVGGAIITGANEYPRQGHRYQIEARLVADQRDKVPDLKRIKVRNNRGELIPLTALTETKIGKGLMLISRQDRARAIKIYANPAPGHAQQDALVSTEKLARSMIPPGYRIRATGSSQSFRESTDSLIFAMLMGILVSYMVLASQFNSFVHPVAVLMALPFSVSGAFIGLAIGHQSINIYSMIGLILLMGIVKKNSILLVDFTNQVRGEGLPVREALLKACPVRLRPILMTSIATVTAALPEAIHMGPGSETTVPMAISIIGGVIASTILTLFVVPCVYSLLARFERQDDLV